MAIALIAVIMGTSQCKNKCRFEELNNCNITLYLLGFRLCVVCKKAYLPEERPECKIDLENEGVRCYCCNNLMRSKPKNKQVWNKMVKVVAY